MKKIISLSFFLLFSVLTFSQCPTSNIVLSTQAEIDAFSTNYPNCTVLTHELKVDGDLSPITNLNGLSNLTNTQDVFIINTDITSLQGLNNTETISSFAIWGNTSLPNLQGLSSLVEIGHLEIWVNSGITSLEGIENLESINNINIFSNPNLEDISQLSFLTTLGDGLTLNSNALTTLNGLQNLQVVEGDIAISNENIQNFDELNNLHTIGGSLFIQDNAVIQDLSAFVNIESVFDLYVLNCSNLINLEGLQNITTVSGTLRIGFNSELVDLGFIKNVTSVGYLDIYQNENLQTLQGIESLEQIEHRLFIENNPNLISIEALGSVALPSNIEEAVIFNNTSLEICNNAFICSIISDDNVYKYITNNASGCNSIQEVEESCFLNIDHIELENQISVFPNPVSEMFSVSVDPSNSITNVRIYSALGQLILETINSQINLWNYSTGIYFAEINTDQGSVIKKIVKD